MKAVQGTDMMKAGTCPLPLEDCSLLPPCSTSQLSAFHAQPTLQFCHQRSPPLDEFPSLGHRMSFICHQMVHSFFLLEACGWFSARGPHSSPSVSCLCSGLILSSCSFCCFLMQGSRTMRGQGWGGGCLSLAMGAVGTTGLQAALLLERVCSGLSMAQTRNKSALDLWSKASPGRGDSRDREGADAQEQPSHEAQCSPSMLHPTSTSLAPRSGQTDRWTWWPPPALMPSLRGTAGCQPWERSTYGGKGMPAAPGR